MGAVGGGENRSSGGGIAEIKGEGVLKLVWFASEAFSRFVRAFFGNRRTLYLASGAALATRF